MTNSLFNQTAPVFILTLGALDAILAKTAAFASDRGLTDEAVLATRLYPDMLALSSQVRIATDTAKGAAARLTGGSAPVFADDETRFDELRARIGRARDFIASLDAAAFEGAEALQIQIKTPRGDLTFAAPDYVNHWALPNFFFHVSMTHALARSLGVPVGKLDYLGPVPMLGPSPF